MGLSSYESFHSFIPKKRRRVNCNPIFKKKTMFTSRRSWEHNVRNANKFQEKMAQALEKLYTIDSDDFWHKQFCFTA